MTAQTFTVFAEGGMFLNNARSHAGFGLQELIDLYISHYRETPIAWAGEWTIGSGGRATNADLRAESIAAGRLIEFRDGKYIPLGVAEEAPKPIKIERISPIDGPFFPPMPPFSVRVGATEKKRPALTWADSKRVDRFPGFVVTSGECDLHRPYEGLIHPLQRMADERDPLFGSAFLKG